MQWLCLEREKTSAWSCEVTESLEATSPQCEVAFLLHQVDAMNLYSESASLVDHVLLADAPVDLRDLCSNRQLTSRHYALTIETLRFLPVLERLVKSTGIVQAEAKVLGKKASPSSKSLALVLVHDLLFGKKGIILPKEHKIRQAIERYATRLSANKQREKIRLGVTSDEGLTSDISSLIRLNDRKGKSKAQVDDEDGDADEREGTVRWLRVNENKWTTQEATQWLEANDWHQRHAMNDSQTLTGRGFFVDPHIPNLLGLAADALNLRKFAPYLDGRLIAQDKASCMPGFLLLQGLADQGSSLFVLDATAAPGNKTSYVSAGLKVLGSGQVHAFERDAQRYKTLNKMMRLAGCSNTETHLQDFLAVSPKMKPFSAATHILVDPSCSGSGIHDDDKDISTEGELQTRLQKLSAFQKHILSHALRFAKVQKVVYSTCSVHQEENEDVVMAALAQKDIDTKWRIASREEALPLWPLRGRDVSGSTTATQEQLDGMIRCDRSMGTHGFFVAVLVCKAKTAQTSDIVQAPPSPQSNGKTRTQQTRDISLLRLAHIARRKRSHERIDRARRRLGASEMLVDSQESHNHHHHGCC